MPYYVVESYGIFFANDISVRFDDTQRLADDVSSASATAAQALDLDSLRSATNFLEI